MKYILLDGTEFDGPVFHPSMEVASLFTTTGIKTFRSVFDSDGSLIERVELAVGEDGMFIYPEDDV